MTVWMYSLTDRTEEQFGFVLLPLVDLRGQGYTKKHLLVKSFENGQLQNTAVVCGIEVMDHEDAMNTKEDRIYEYEAYRPFVGWSHEHLREGSEPRFVLDHEYGDHELDREERKGAASHDGGTLSSLLSRAFVRACQVPRSRRRTTTCPL